MNDEIERLEQASGFPPLLGARPRVLVLGSMPGVASLRAQQYYAHPRNAFWPLMAKLLGFEVELTYSQRVAALTQGGVAVWDVLKSCQRRGSADAAIDRDSVVVNDFGDFFDRYPQIVAVACNGATAWTCYQRHVLPGLSLPQRGLVVLKLPSTSPAHAALSLEDKYHAWRVLAQWLSAAEVQSR
jgi:TDG/mug DNA glycosylase family protein